MKTVKRFFRLPIIKRKKSLRHGDISYQFSSYVTLTAAEEPGPHPYGPILLNKLGLGTGLNPEFPNNHVLGTRLHAYPCLLYLILNSCIFAFINAQIILIKRSSALISGQEDMALLCVPLCPLWLKFRHLPTVFPCTLAIISSVTERGASS